MQHRKLNFLKTKKKGLLERRRYQRLPLAPQESHFPRKIGQKNLNSNLTGRTDTALSDFRSQIKITELNTKKNGRITIFLINEIFNRPTIKSVSATPGVHKKALVVEQILNFSFRFIQYEALRNGGCSCDAVVRFNKGSSRARVRAMHICHAFHAPTVPSVSSREALLRLD